MRDLVCRGPVQAAQSDRVQSDVQMQEIGVAHVRNAILVTCKGDNLIIQKCLMPEQSLQETTQNYVEANTEQVLRTLLVALKANQ